MANRRPLARSFVAAILVTGLLTAQFALSSAPSGASGTTSLSPPVIKEPFTPLPCHRGTTLGLEGCAEGQLLTTDRRLDEQVKLIFAAIATMSQRRGFVAVEEQWLAYRGSDCSNVAATFQGGTIQPVEYALCEVHDDETRSADLRSFFALLEEGKSPVPAWP